MSKDSRMRNLVVRIDEETRGALDAAADETGKQPVASLVRLILSEWAKNRAATRGHIAA